MKKVALLLVFLAFVGMQVFAQTLIKGTVADTEGNPVPGATIVPKGASQQGTVSDGSGAYSLSVPDGTEALIFTFIGKKTLEEPINGRTVINVVMEDESEVIDEVVVTALGIQRDQKSLGYAATEVSGDEIIRSGSQNALNALRGKVAGLDISSASGAPGSSTRVFLRGYSSLAGGNQPLYVIDGVPVDNSAIVSDDLNGGLDFGNKMNDINPDDIASVNIMQGGSASVLYGSRAANGVIIITTKSGSQKDKLQVNYTGNLSFETPLKLPQFQNTFGQGFYGEPDLIENTSWGPKMDGKVRPWGWVVDNSQQIKPFEAVPDNVKDFFDVGVTQNHSVAVSNGNENLGYYLSYGLVDADGVFPTDADSYKRHTLSLRGNTKYKDLNVSASINYVKKKSSFVPTGQDQSVYDNVMQVPRSMSIVDGKDYEDKFWNLDNYYSGYTVNPYYVLSEHGNEANEDRVFGRISFDYFFTEWLSIKWNVGSEVSNTNLQQWRAITEVSRNDYNDDIGMVSDADYYQSQINSDLYLNFNRQFGADWNVNAILGHNVNQRIIQENSMQVLGLDIPYFYDVANSSATPSVNQAYSKRRLIGVFGNVDISYKDMLYLDISARNDWSSTLPVDNRSFFYPGASLSFVFTEVIPDNSILTFGKLRAGISQTGNDAAPYQIYSVYVPANHTDGYRDITYPLPGSINGFEISNQIGNLGLQPEISTEFEVGTELRLLDNRISIDATYYNKDITKLIWPASLTPSTGYTSQVMNLGRITNKGIAIGAEFTPVRTNDLVWTISLNYTNNDNELVELDEAGEIEQIDIGGTSRLNFVAKPGFPIGMYYGEVPKYHEGKVVVDATGLPVPEDEYGIYGSAQYDWMGGITNSVSYKGLSLSFTFDTKQGGLMYSRTAEMQYFTGTAPKTLYNDREPFIIPNSVFYDPDNEVYLENTVPVTPEVVHTYWGQAYGGGLFNRRFVIDKTYVKLREVVIAYSLPQSVCSKVSISNAEIRLFGRNLLIWTAEDNTFIDPESTTFGNDIEADYGEFSATPSVRSMGVGLNLTF